MKQTYTQKLTISFILILLLFSIGVIIFERNRAKQYKTEALEERLDGYAEIIHNYTERENRNLQVSLDTLLSVLPANLRVTIINKEGTVLFDNRLHESNEIENHALRPEIVSAKDKGKGIDIRKSTSTQKEYLYYAKDLGNSFIRVALPYSIQVKDFLKPDNSFIYFLVFMLVIGIIFIFYTGNYFGKTVKQLQEFSLAIKNQQKVEIPDFPDDEIGYIGRQIAKDYKRIKGNEEKLFLEHEKLLMHIQSSNEGVCFFTPDKQVSFYNGLFLQYVNMLADEVVVDAKGILDEKVFAEIYDFVTLNNENSYFETTINKNGKYFVARVNIFYDKSFEIILTDNTRQEKNRLLKREMTGNIAHELRTPVAGIRGYLETILENDLNPEKQHEFVYKAFDQTMILSELIGDMGLLSKMNEAPDTFRSGTVCLQDLIGKVKEDLGAQLKEKDIIIHSTLSPDLKIAGNENLIYSIFRNLTDNVIKYAGESITITISKYHQEGKFAYFSFSDNGIGIEDEKHLNRLFERFYRVTEGRTRESGGSGLGLSIVKNAVEFHGGIISVKNRKGGGLEFLFSLPVG
ncbi:MAG: two-component sensor histidine kinase [Bacteroidales bacterium]|nr:two-component sensor histidine kinase [Bacteroidales bacterium]